jgi:CelD/BcsL family acetyltransferase involved in cellulose biosynthesis
MYQTRITPAALTVEKAAGCPRALDTLAEQGLGDHRFLRAAWFAAGAAAGGATVLASSADGAAVLAIPVTPFGPALLGARKVPGSYWPYRGVLAAAGARAEDFAAALAAPAARALGPIWRLGPTRADDPVTRLLIEGAMAAGWRVITQRAGTVWTIDLAALAARGWPSASTGRKLRRYEARLAELGPVEWRYVRGAGWDEHALEAMGSIEAASWIARDANGSGAKFLHPHQRAIWRAALRDPVLAEMLCATILMIAGRPVAFSFDLDDGPVQYGIAGSFVADLADYNIGRLTNYRAMADAIAAGQTVMDMGAGDGGYKREMGAVAGYDLIDVLLVKHPLAARALRGWWERHGQAQGHQA